MPSWLSPAKRLIRNQQIEGSNPSGGLNFSYDLITSSRRSTFYFTSERLNMEIAETTGKISAYLIANGLPIEYQDVAIAATFVKEKGDWLLTKNKKYFMIIPGLEKAAITPAEFKQRPSLRFLHHRAHKRVKRLLLPGFKISYSLRVLDNDFIYCNRYKMIIVLNPRLAQHRDYCQRNVHSVL